METSNGIVERVKKFLSKHPLLCNWAARLKAIFYGIRAIFFRLTRKQGCYIDKSVKVTGWSHVSLGVNSVIASGSWLNVNIRDEKFPTLIIGKNCFIGRNNFITVGKKIIFGDYCLTATNCSFVGSSHDISDPNLPYISTGVDSNATIEIGANCFFGYGTTVIGSVSIGYGSVIGAGAIVLKDVPPLSVVIGNPGRVVKRFSVKKKCWVPIDEYIEEPLMSEEKYVDSMHRNTGYYPLPVSAARSFLGDV